MSLRTPDEYDPGMEPRLSVDQHLAAIRREGELFAAAVADGNMDATVPTCPEWTLRELTHHLGRTHVWAAAHIEQARPDPLSDEEQRVEWGSMPADADVVPWYRSVLGRLVAALEAAPADLQCWTFLPNSPPPRAFWARRQAHELAIHRVDAQGVQGPVAPVPVDFALDGIDELLFGFYSRPRSRLRSERPRTLSVRTPEAAWLVHIGDEGARAERSEARGDCSIHGRANDLYYALWNRLPLHDYRVDGDPGVLDLWTGKATVRWS
jgi:uncharacterized protein (TIGR03083 family)